MKNYSKLSRQPRRSVFSSFFIENEGKLPESAIYSTCPVGCTNNSEKLSRKRKTTTLIAEHDSAFRSPCAWWKFKAFLWQWRREEENSSARFFTLFLCNYRRHAISDGKLFAVLHIVCFLTQLLFSVWKAQLFTWKIATEYFSPANRKLNDTNFHPFSMAVVNGSTGKINMEKTVVA